MTTPVACAVRTNHVQAAQQKNRAHGARYVIAITLGLFAGAVLAAGNAPTLNDFRSDGCSLFPDGDLNDRKRWCDCCLEHDIAYWRGGTRDERSAADERLRECVLRTTGNRVLADTMFAGVRVGGGPVFPTGYCWGYGWKLGRNYTPLDEVERKMADDKLRAYRESGKRFACE